MKNEQLPEVFIDDKDYLENDLDSDTGATTAEYAMLAGGICVGGGVLFTVLSGGLLSKLVGKLIEGVFDAVMSLITSGISNFL